jgi:cytochrome c oxidase subunit 1
VAKRGDLSFVVTQSSSDIKVLNFIKENFGFGNINIQSSKQKTHRFVVYKQQDLLLICLIFNGNMVFPTISAKFNIFLSRLNEKLVKQNLTPIIPIIINVKVSLDDH